MLLYPATLVPVERIELSTFGLQNNRVPLFVLQVMRELQGYLALCGVRPLLLCLISCLLRFDRTSQSASLWASGIANTSPWSHAGVVQSLPQNVDRPATFQDGVKSPQMVKGKGAESPVLFCACLAVDAAIRPNFRLGLGR